MSSEDRRALLAQQTALLVAQDYRVESQISEFQTVVIKGKRINHPLHVAVSILTVGVWLIGYLTIVATAGEKREMLQVDDWGHVLRHKL